MASVAVIKTVSIHATTEQGVT